MPIDTVSLRKKEASIKRIGFGFTKPYLFLQKII